MTMFDWNADSADDKPEVSGFIWVYWLISIPLTLMVMIFWILWSRREHLKSQKRLGRFKRQINEQEGVLSQSEKV
jgi:hypothetical protein